MKDFFISYNADDKSWAEWIAFALEQKGYRVSIQAWDFRPGSNFVLEMQRAAAEAERTIMVLSPSYIRSQFTSPEWAAAFARDPTGSNRKLVPIVVRPCELPGLLAPLVHIDISGEEEETARQLIYGGVAKERAKPAKQPAYPGPSKPVAQKVFPGHSSPDSTKASTYVPRILRAPTDADRVRFTRKAFDLIRDYFERGLGTLDQQSENVEWDFQPESQSAFVAEIFVNGKSTARARVWLGGLLSNDGISFAEGYTHHYNSNSCNESLSAEVHDGKLYLKALMGSFALGQAAKHLNLERLNPDDAAEYLWRRLIAPLER